jgi:cyclophilin family peptidyl-prolyl cis-trans isomerase
MYTVGNTVWNKTSGVVYAIHDVIDPTLSKSVPIDYTPFVYMTVRQNEKVLGDVIIRLYDIDLPKTTSNFRSLCKTKRYVDVPFHRAIKGFMVQGGDITNLDGTGGESIYGKEFEDEVFLYNNAYATISMANGGPNTNNSQFFINTCVSGNHHLDNKHVVFGKVVHGMDVIEYIGNNPDNPHPCVIEDCGEIWMEDDEDDDNGGGGGGGGTATTTYGVASGTIDDTRKSVYSDYLSSISK